MPRRARVRAATEPAGPPPTTTTSVASFPARVYRRCQESAGGVAWVSSVRGAVQMRVEISRRWAQSELVRLSHPTRRAEDLLATGQTPGNRGTQSHGSRTGRDRRVTE